MVVSKAMGIQVLAMTLEELSYKRTSRSTRDLAKRHSESSAEGRIRLIKAGSWCMGRIWL